MCPLPMASSGVTPWKEVMAEYLFEDSQLYLKLMHANTFSMCDGKKTMLFPSAVSHPYLNPERIHSQNENDME